jgi:hypothetical protein
MTDQERLLRDINTLDKSIRLNWQELAERPLSPDDRRGIQVHIAFLISDLQTLMKRLG